MSTWKIVADSSSDLALGMPCAEGVSFALAPLKINVGEQTFVDDAALDGQGDGFGTIDGFELEEKRLQVRLDAVDADVQCLRDFLVGASAGKPFEDFALTRG